MATDATEIHSSSAIEIERICELENGSLCYVKSQYSSQQACRKSDNENR